MAKVEKVVRKMFAVCELTHKLVYTKVDGPRGYGTDVTEGTANVTIVSEYYQEHAAGLAAAKHALKLEENPPEGYKAVVTVIPVWRVR